MKLTQGQKQCHVTELIRRFYDLQRKCGHMRKKETMEDRNPPPSPAPPVYIDSAKTNINIAICITMTQIKLPYFC